MPYRVLVCLMVMWVVGLPAACARPEAPAPLPASEPAQPARSLAGYEAHFVLTWNGARIGDASERLRRHGRELRFERRERLAMRRGPALVHAETVITIATDRDLEARAISVRQVSGGAVVRGRAERDEHGQWLARYGHEPARTLPGDAVPAELVPLLLAARPDPAEFDGSVLLAGYGFATARLRVDATRERMLTATLSTPHGMLRGRWALTQHRTVARAMGDDGVMARRVSAQEVTEPFEPPEVVDSVSVPVLDMGSAAPDRALELIIEPVQRSAPPPLPGQRVNVHASTWHVRLMPGDGLAGLDISPPAAQRAPRQEPPPELIALARRIVDAAGARSARDQVTALARATADLIEDDLGSPGTSARAALALGRGDCTAHATLFAGLARARGIPVRLVTGYRLDAGRLVRHRWAVARVDSAWITVDPTYGESPAAPRLLGLAVHGASAADMAMVDEIAFAGFRQARAWHP